ncbi:MAG: hypothetical protein VKI81_05260 [Synechococcaceae cyanobacterium]|nr:hypothetical protein [Synechococcaceae cyanobacterium]
MTAPQSLLQAAANRLAARLGSGLADAAAGLAVIAQDAPERLRQEWGLFWEEVEREAERLEGRGAAGGESAAPPRPAGAGVDPQERIDALRARVAEIARRLEQEPRGPQG